MKTIKRNELTKEMVEKAMECETAEELIAAAKAEGYEMTKDEAEAYMAEISDFELDDATLSRAAGGSMYSCKNKHTGDDREDMEPGKMPEAFLRGELTGGEDF
ncbi:MAG: Nif11-like leader peptide family RiPP precursor [Schwartzia sp.]|nr:Nif11-like leader peptide family RiPP precursor [Schwartzia sp. (in: firmicutes)]